MADKILLFFNRGSGSFWHFWSDAASQPSQMPVTLWRGAEEDSSCRLTPLYSLIMKWANVIGFAVCLGILWGQLILAIWRFRMRFTRHQFSSVPELCLTLCDPKDCNTSGLPIHHQLLEFTQIHVHWVGDAIQPSHPLSSPSPPTLNLSQHQGLFKWVTSSHQVAKSIVVSASTLVLPMNTQDWSPLGWTASIYLQSKGLSRVFSNTSVQKHKFFGAQLSL